MQKKKKDRGNLYLNIFRILLDLKRFYEKSLILLDFDWGYNISLVVFSSYSFKLVFKVRNQRHKITDSMNLAVGWPHSFGDDWTSFQPWFINMRMHSDSRINRGNLIFLLTKTKRREKKNDWKQFFMPHRTKNIINCRLMIFQVNMYCILYTKRTY